jgi:beta-galactosidase
MRAEASGAAELLGFGSGNPITEENYTRGQFNAFRGSALAVLRAGYETGEANLTVRAEGFEPVEIRLTVK